MAKGIIWLLLIHQLPPKPDYLRVKTRRRLQKIGAAAVKNTVYVLPKREETLEDFHWVLEEIRREGGDGMVCSAEMIEGMPDEEVIRLFNNDRDAAYGELGAQARSLQARLRTRRYSAEMARQTEGELGRFQRGLAEIAKTDFFAAPGRKAVERTLGEVEKHMKTMTAEPKKGPLAEGNKRRGYTGRTWVTRKNIFVDRMASAWLIKRFIDRRARFKFVDPENYRAGEKELCFDMFEGEFTHRGDQCTFEALCLDFGLRDSGLSALKEIVHDIDVKDAKFGREEAAGIALALRSLRTSHPKDAARLEAGYAFFDALYAELSVPKRKRDGD